MINQKQQSFLNNISRFSKKKRRLQAMGAAIHFIMLILSVWMSAALADQVFSFSETSRWGLLLINALIFGAAAYLLLVKPFLRYFRDNKALRLITDAKETARYYPETGDAFIIACQLITEEKGKTAGSDALRQAAIDHILSAYIQEDFAARLSLQSFLPPTKLLVPVFTALILLTAIQWETLGHSGLRLLNPTNEYLQIPAYNFSVEPGNIKLLKGSPLTIKAFYSGPLLEGCFLIRQTGEEKQQMPLQKQEGFYRLTLNDIRSGFIYRLSGIPVTETYSGRLLSEEFKVVVLIPPRVEQLDIRVQPPLYTGLSEFQQERNIGDVSALRGSRVNIEIKLNKTVRAGQLLFASGKKLPLRLRREQLDGVFTVNQNDSYQIILEDTSGISNQNPISYRIAVAEDNAPFVDVTEPGIDVESPIDGNLALKIEAEDDFGIRALSLHYMIVNEQPSKSDTIKISLPMKNIKGRNGQSAYLLDFNKLPLTFGDTLKYFARAVDNNTLNGGSSARSKIYSIRFPSIEELFESMDKQQQREISALDEVREESGKLKKDLEKIDRQMKRAEKMDWEKKQAIEKTVQKQKELQKKLEQIRKELDEAVKKLEQNNLISPELLEKYTKLQEMFRETLSPELMQALQKLQDSLQKSNPQEVRQALAKLKLNQEAFEKSIERTMELLKRVQFEQHLDRLVKKAEKLARQQEKISKEIDAPKTKSDENIEQTRQMQKQQKKQLENLTADLQRFLKEELLEQFAKTQQITDSVSSALQKGTVGKKMEKIERQLATGRRSQAAQNSKQLQRQLNNLSRQMQQAQQMMRQKSKDDTAKEMRNIGRRMLELSFKEEQISRKTQKTSPLGNNFSSILKAQGEALRNFQTIVKKTAALAQKTFFIQPQISKSLRQVQNKMQQSLQQLSERNKNAALRSQGEAMSSLNASVLGMSRALSQMMQSQSGTGFDEFMKQMQQMAGQQGQLNSESMNLMQGQGNEGMLSGEQAAKAKRLGGRQAALRQALQELGGKTGKREDILGELSQIGKDMERVEKDLLRGRFDRTTVERQRRILSRMLDAQRSLEQRKYSKKRKAEQAKQYGVKDPSEADGGEVPDKKIIEEAMRRALKQGYSRDYQKLIEIYFEKLLRANDAGN